VWVHQPGAGLAFFWAPSDLDIFADDGEELDALADVLRNLLEANWQQTMDQIELRNIAESMECSFSLQVGPGMDSEEGRC
jgi:hypothetical protein